MALYQLSISSALAAEPLRLWAHATDLEGVNRELWPLARMTYPPGMRRLEPGQIVPGGRLFRSWIFAFGFLPIDYDDLAVEQIDPPRYFLERSTMLTQKVWIHERTIEPVAGGSRISDQVQFVPRIGWLGPVHLLVFRMTFRLRHRNLRRMFSTI
jgi:ligand-binding SRPBCC domain-containing protein